MNELVRHVGLRQSTVSHHLAILRKEGVLKAERRGKELWHRLDPKRVAVCCGKLTVAFSRGKKGK